MTSPESQPRYGRMRSDFSPEELAHAPGSPMAAGPGLGLAAPGSASSTPDSDRDTDSDRNRARSTDRDRASGSVSGRPRDERHPRRDGLTDDMGIGPDDLLPPPGPARHGPLTPVEVATVGLLGGLAVVLGVVSAIMPFFQSVFQMLAAVPIAMVTVRLRARSGVAVVAVTVLTALALGGATSAVTVAQAALGGAAVGALVRRRVGMTGAAIAGVALGAAVAALTDAALWLLSDLRDLVLESTRVSITGYLDLFGRWSVLAPITDWLTRVLNAALAWWYVVIPAGVLLGMAGMVLLAFWILRIVLARLRLGSDWDPLQAVLDRQTREDEDARGRSTDPASHAAPTGHTGHTGRGAAPAPAPLPVRLTGVRYRYPGAPTDAGPEADALRGIDLAIRSGEFAVIVGPNGSGKSTLSLVLAGADPSEGAVERPGSVGLGRPGGTALLAQRSELQMLGDTAAEDVLWGLSPEERAATDVRELLDLVGLAGLGEARTAHLSGGQLQRLALAGALARRPRLLLSDESTAMVDPAGRADLIRILSRLPARGTSVVHVTHDPEEAAGADRLIRMESGRVVSDVSREIRLRAAARSAPPEPRDPGILPGGPIDEGAPTAPAWVPPPGRQVEHLWADRVTQAYDVGTPWEHVVLHDISLIVSPGDALLITGGNGSGKTTLSRVLTGLVAPTWGRCTLGGTPVTQRVGDVAMSMQFARLQLQRPSVRSDILAAARAGSRQGDEGDPAEKDRLVRAAMEEVGLPPELERRGIDQLSGGQMRRVALAGLLASDPTAIVLDEPLAGLDAESRLLLIDALERRRRQGLAVLVISHDTDGLDRLCRRSLTLDEGVLS